MESKVDIEKIIENIEAREKKRSELMPDEKTALLVMFEAYQRLMDLGFKEAIYCPKDGRLFEAIESGSTGIHKCSYDGKWPNGHWWVHEANDMWPSRPILFRLIKESNNGNP